MIDSYISPIRYNDLYVQTVDSILNIESFDEVLRTTFDQILDLISVGTECSSSTTTTTGTNQHLLPEEQAAQDHPQRPDIEGQLLFRVITAPRTSSYGAS